MVGRFNYREIVAGERIVWLNSFSNPHCGITRAPFSELCPLEIENTVNFNEQAGSTTVALRAVPFGEAADERQYFIDLRPSLQEGYGGTSINWPSTWPRPDAPALVGPATTPANRGVAINERQTIS